MGNGLTFAPAEAGGWLELRNPRGSFNQNRKHSRIRLKTKTT